MDLYRHVGKWWWLLVVCSHYQRHLGMKRKISTDVNLYVKFYSVARIFYILDLPSWLKKEFSVGRLQYLSRGLGCIRVLIGSKWVLSLIDGSHVVLGWIVICCWKYHSKLRPEVLIVARLVQLHIIGYHLERREKFVKRTLVLNILNFKVIVINTYKNNHHSPDYEEN